MGGGGLLSFFYLRFFHFVFVCFFFWGPLFLLKLVPISSETIMLFSRQLVAAKRPKRRCIRGRFHSRTCEEQQRIGLRFQKKRRRRRNNRERDVQVTGRGTNLE